MKVTKVLLAALAGTTAMTLFSYVTSRKKNKNFKEPQLLADMVLTAIPQIEKPASGAAGWVLHYGTGLFFAAIYELLSNDDKIKPTLPYGIFIGGLNGAVAVLIWKATFSLHPGPPRIHFEDFYKHVILAHVIYGTITLCTLEK